ncbi:MAG TPA: glycosyltransferase [Acidisarcina sp.]|nr:glycosyltransferase [Acidisarcina sp.]
MIHRILHVGKYYPPHRGGMETHLRDLAVRQTGAASVNVIVANSAPRHERSVIEEVSVTRVARIGTIASMPICPGLMAAIRSTPAHLVHVHMPNPGAALAFLMSGHSGKLVITHHADTMGRRFLREFSDPFVYRLMHRADRIIVTSTRYLDSSSELAPFREKCRVIPLGIEIEDPTITGHTTREELSRQFGPRLILAVGRLVPYKGFDVLIRAMKHVDARLLLIGTGPEHKALASLVEAEGVKEKIAMLGRVDNLDPYFAVASVFVLPSVTRAEAFGIVQMEAMAAGLPVVNTDIDSGVPEVSVHGKTGITVPPGDVTALSEAMQLLLERDDLRLQFGEAARARVETEYTADLMTARTLSIYSEVLGQRETWERQDGT